MHRILVPNPNIELQSLTNSHARVINFSYFFIIPVSRCGCFEAFLRLQLLILLLIKLYAAPGYVLTLLDLLFGSEIMMESNTATTYGRNFSLLLVCAIIDCIDTSYNGIYVINSSVETLAIYHLSV